MLEDFYLRWRVCLLFVLLILSCIALALFLLLLSLIFLLFVIYTANPFTLDKWIIPQLRKNWCRILALAGRSNALQSCVTSLPDNPKDLPI